MLAIRVSQSLLSLRSSPSPASKTLASSFTSPNHRRLFSAPKRNRSSSSGIRASAQKSENADKLIESVEAFIFDCDGVIWKGDSLIEGVPDTLDMLRSKITS